MIFFPSLDEVILDACMREGNRRAMEEEQHQQRLKAEWETRQEREKFYGDQGQCYDAEYKEVTEHKLIERD